MPGIEIEIEVYCSCGAGLCNNTSEGRTTGRNQPYFTVEPCEKCLESAKEDAYQEGYDQALKEKEEVMHL